MMRRPAGRARGPSPLKRWKAKRDRVIALAAEEGATHRFLADVFDLSHSRIAAILKEQATKQKTEGTAE